MPILKTDSRGLVTQGALLGFVRPASRLSAIETCEGNVQLSYFDDQGRMRQTNFDAASDSKNTTFEQWIPDSVRTCLNLNQNSSLVTLERAVYLDEEWTIEAWFAYPLPVPEPSTYNSLVRGKDTDNPIIVKKGDNSDLLGIVIAGDFKSSGYDLTSLSPGWHHLTAVAQGDTTLFYIDGKKIGDTKAKAIADAKTALENANQSQKPQAQANLTAIENGNFNLTSNVKYIGNVQGGQQQFGKIAEVRIWGIALSAEEIAVNSKTLLTGNEPGLLAYYPLTEAKDTTVQNKTGDGNNGTITGASWWGCAAPIGKLGEIEAEVEAEVEVETPQVMQFHGVDDYIEVPYNSNLNPQQFTISCWVKVTRTQNSLCSLLNSTHANKGYSIYTSIDNKVWFNIFVLGRETQDRVGASAGLTFNVWKHICAIFNGTNITLYINGINASTTNLDYIAILNHYQDYDTIICNT